MDSDQRRLVAAMPLHAITSTYGEKGLRERFSVEIASLPEGDQRRLNRAAPEQYREHVEESLQRDPWARVIKASDFADNGVGLIHSTGPRLRQLAAKYAPLVPILRELIDLPDTPLHAAAKQHILAQLDRAADRFAAVLPPNETPARG